MVDLGAVVAFKPQFDGAPRRNNWAIHDWVRELARTRVSDTLFHNWWRLNEPGLLQVGGHTAHNVRKQIWRSTGEDPQ